MYRKKNIFKEKIIELYLELENSLVKVKREAINGLKHKNVFKKIIKCK